MVDIGRFGSGGTTAKYPRGVKGKEACAKGHCGGPAALEEQVESNSGTQCDARRADVECGRSEHHHQPKVVGFVEWLGFRIPAQQRPQSQHGRGGVGDFAHHYGARPQQVAIEAHQNHSSPRQRFGPAGFFGDSAEPPECRAKKDSVHQFEPCEAFAKQHCHGQKCGVTRRKMVGRRRPRHVNVGVALTLN